jgi:hypothetical protein
MEHTMLREEAAALARQAASEALGFPVEDLDVENALAAHAGDRTEDLVDLLAAKAAEFKKSGRRRIGWDPEINDLKIVLAVRAAVPGVGIDDEIEITTRRWATREAATLTVSLDCLAKALAEESAVTDPIARARLMASLCRRAMPAFQGDCVLAMREAERYAAEAGDHEAEEEGDEGKP